MNQNISIKSMKTSSKTNQLKSNKTNFKVDEIAQLHRQIDNEKTHAEQVSSIEC